MAYYKTVIQVEVLTDESFEWINLEDVSYSIMYGSASGYVTEVSRAVITEEELVKECSKHGTDPGFFTEYAKEVGLD